jgi:hypothetical protein
LLAHGGWFSPGTRASSTTKTGRHDISEILQLYPSLIFILQLLGSLYIVYLAYKFIRSDKLAGPGLNTKGNIKPKNKRKY